MDIRRVLKLIVTDMDPTNRRFNNTQLRRTEAHQAPVLELERDLPHVHTSFCRQ